MSTLKICKKVHKARDAGIQSGDLVLYELPNGDLKALKLETKTYVVYVHSTFQPTKLLLGRSTLERLVTFMQTNLSDSRTA